MEPDVQPPEPPPLPHTAADGIARNPAAGAARRSGGPAEPNVVSTHIDDTFGLIEGLVAENVELACNLPPSPQPSAQPFAWQEAVLNVALRCWKCDAQLSRGRRAAVSIGLPRACLCLACLRALEAQACEEG